MYQTSKLGNYFLLIIADNFPKNMFRSAMIFTFFSVWPHTPWQQISPPSLYDGIHAYEQLRAELGGRGRENEDKCFVPTRIVLNLYDISPPYKYTMYVSCKSVESAFSIVMEHRYTESLQMLRCVVWCSKLVSRHYVNCAAELRLKEQQTSLYNPFSIHCQHKSKCSSNIFTQYFYNHTIHLIHFMVHYIVKNYLYIFSIFNSFLWCNADISAGIISVFSVILMTFSYDSQSSTNPNFQIRPRPLSYVVLNRIHIRCFTMRLQSERPCRISCGFFSDNK